MSLRSVGIITFFTLFLSLSLTAQESSDSSRSNYALLWEITGPNLSEPSYVFGSMHVRYSSVFEFPDSLLICLAESDAFANEIHLDSAMQRTFEVYLDQQELQVDSSYIRLLQERVLRPDTTDNEEDSSDFSDFKSFLQRSKEGRDLRSGDNMPTMLDAYLMEAARRLGKELYGLEKIDEHLYEPEDEETPASTKFKFSLFANDGDELLRLYYNGDLAPIDAFIRAEPESFNQFALVARNYVMVDAMERIMSKKRLFSVVGTAHLPGEEGVLQLLRNRGYTLRRVMPTFTGLRDSVLLPELERPWPTEDAQRGLYELAMPLGVQHIHHDGVNSSHLSFDIGRGLSYLLLTSSMLPYDYNNFDLLFFEEDGYEVIKKTPYEHNGLSGYRYELEIPGNEVQYYRAYTFFYDQQLYYLQIGAYERDHLEDNEDAETFLDRFTVNRKNRNKWVEVVDSLGGFKVRLPDNYLYSASSRNEAIPYQKAMDYPQHQYRAGFEEEKASVWLQYYDVSPGTYRKRVWDQLQEGVELLEGQYGIDISVTKRAENQSYPSWELSGEFLDEGLLFKGKVMAKGNRLYVLSAVDESRQQLTKKFLSSFRLIEKAPATTPTFHPFYEDQVQLLLPGTPATVLESKEEDLSTPARYRQSIQGLDPETGASYEVEVLLLPSYHSLIDAEALHQQELSRMLSDQDSLLGLTRVEMGDDFSVPIYTYNTSHDQLQQKLQLYRWGDYWVKKRLVALPGYFESNTAVAFFTGDEWSVPASSPPLAGGLSETLMNQLQSADSLQLRWALKSIDPQLTFKRADIPQLREVILDNNWVARGLEKEASDLIVRSLLTLGKEGEQLLIESFPEIRELPLQESFLTTLAQEASTESRNTLFRILAKDLPLPDDLSAKALMGFQDKPALVLQYWADFSRLMEDDHEPLYTWELARQVLSQDSLSKAPVLAARHLFLERGQELLETWEGQDEDVPVAVFQVYKLLPEAPSLMRQVQDILNRTEVDKVSVEAAAYLLAKGKDLPKKKVRQILKQQSLRVPFIRVLNEFDRLDLVDTRYFDEEAIARTMLLELLDAEGVVSNVENLDVIEALFRGEPQRAFVYSFDLDGDRSRLAVVGFFSTTKSKAFLDEGLVNFTLYTITRRRQSRKAQQLVDELNDF